MKTDSILAGIPSAPRVSVGKRCRLTPVLEPWQSIFFMVLAIVLVLAGSGPAQDWVQVDASRHWSNREGHAGLEYGGRIWVMGGDYGGLQYSGEVWASTNGTTWQLITPVAPWPRRAWHACTEFSNKIWLLGGRVMTSTEVGARNDVWFSTNGSQWTQTILSAPWTPRYWHAAVPFNNRLWVLGGCIEPATATPKLNDVWRTADGTNWTEVTASAPWSPRYSFAATVFSHRMWIFGGVTDQGRTNDVWYTADGTNWFEATSSAPWEPRSLFPTCADAEGIWLFGGCSSRWGPYTSVFLNDIWFSRDGVNWRQVWDAAPWQPRQAHLAVPFLNEHWIISGRDGPGLTFGLINDIWRTVPLTLHAYRATNVVRLTWPSLSDRVYTLWESSDVANGIWSETQREIPATPPQNELTNTLSGGTKLYKLSVRTTSQ